MNKCIYCGKEIPKRTGGNKFCSLECGSRYRYLYKSETIKVTSMCKTHGKQRNSYSYCPICGEKLAKENQIVIGHKKPKHY
jgi:predicted RNA-binding Zn-ribbon protein involved in translation (DUF1610 family)